MPSMTNTASPLAVYLLLSMISTAKSARPSFFNRGNVRPSTHGPRIKWSSGSVQWNWSHRRWRHWNVNFESIIFLAAVFHSFQTMTNYSNGLELNSIWLNGNLCSKQWTLFYLGRPFMITQLKVIKIDFIFFVKTSFSFKQAQFS